VVLQLTWGCRLLLLCSLAMFFRAVLSPDTVVSPSAQLLFFLGHLSCTSPPPLLRSLCLLCLLLLSSCSVHMLLSPVCCCTTLGSASSYAAAAAAAAALCCPSEPSALFSAMCVTFFFAASLSIAISAVNYPALHLFADKTLIKLPINTSWGCN